SLGKTTQKRYPEPHRRCNQKLFPPLQHRRCSGFLSGIDSASSVGAGIGDHRTAGRTGSPHASEPTVELVYARRRQGQSRPQSPRAVGVKRERNCPQVSLDERPLSEPVSAHRAHQDLRRSDSIHQDYRAAPGIDPADCAVIELPRPRHALPRTLDGVLIPHESKGLLIVLHRLPFFSLQSEKLSETLMRGGKVSLDLQRIIKRLRCLVIPTL